MLYNFPKLNHWICKAISITFSFQAIDTTLNICKATSLSLLRGNILLAKRDMVILILCFHCQDIKNKMQTSQYRKFRIWEMKEGK